ncbi:MAG: hypothetical protein NTU98_09405 [Bacteroidetes bacterium]|nr:hypothetical protein [Bacteroidota bacterium]
MYHSKHSIEPGEEKDPTFYLYRKKDHPYHIDYCFASEKIIERGVDFSVGNVDEWIEFSDHTPIFIDIKNNVEKHPA